MAIRARGVAIPIQCNRLVHPVRVTGVREWMALLPVERPYHIAERLSQVIAAVMTGKTCLRSLIDVRRNARVFAQQPHAKCVMGSVATGTRKFVHGRISAQLRYRNSG